MDRVRIRRRNSVRGTFVTHAVKIPLDVDGLYADFCEVWKEGRDDVLCILLAARRGTAVWSKWRCDVHRRSLLRELAACKCIAHSANALIGWYW